MPDRIVISDTTPIIALALARQLNLLYALYEQVWIPPAVAAELRAGGVRAGAAELATASYIRTVALNDPRRADLLSDLDRGEAEVIALAQERHADLVIIDERLGRRHARRLGLRVTGVLGVLIKARQVGHLDAVRPYVDQMQQGGIHLGTALVQRVLELAGEAERLNAR
jgi:predicted nucleic acid-binding protein